MMLAVQESMRLGMQQVTSLGQSDRSKGELVSCGVLFWLDWRTFVL